jgi:hypothetical protein
MYVCTSGHHESNFSTPHKLTRALRHQDDGEACLVAWLWDIQDAA